IDLLPVVGAVETQEYGSNYRGKNLSQARQTALNLGIAPSLYKGGAPWFAISAFYTDVESFESASPECSDFLPAEHPYRLLQMQSARAAPQKRDLPKLAAALGRSDLSLQLEAANGPQSGRARHLVDVATLALRLRPTWELVSLLMSGEIFKF